MTRIAVICLAHSGEIDLIRCTLKYLRNIDCTLFIHIDQKASSDAYSALRDGHRVILVEPRIRVYWGGFQTVQAIVNSIEFAMRFGDFDRFVLITEDSIPIKPIAQFQAAMSSELDFIVAAPVDQEWILLRYRHFYCYDDFSTCPRTAPEQRVVEGTLLLKLMRLEDLRRKGKISLTPLYHGPTWWALTRATVELILRSYREDWRLRESFEFSAIPEEQYLQTIYGTAFGPSQRPFMIADFTREPKPFLFSDPIEIAREASQSACWFLRKARWSPGIAEFVARLS